MTHNYTKEQLHEAFSIEYHAHKNTQAMLNREIRVNAALRYELEYYQNLSRDLARKLVPILKNGKS